MDLTDKISEAVRCHTKSLNPSPLLRSRHCYYITLRELKQTRLYAVILWIKCVALFWLEESLLKCDWGLSITQREIYLETILRESASLYSDHGYSNKHRVSLALVESQVPVSFTRSVSRNDVRETAQNMHTMQQFGVQTSRKVDFRIWNIWYWNLCMGTW